ncbi:hypothetical protein DL93DRAFT_2169362 [Clavulina sp. PMI_390]|nr:hypothetical protein DL93DRAFT_2169362 [Clavulina sp. PMI_390]
MFQSLRQHRNVPATQDEPTTAPSLKLSAVAPIASSSRSALAPRADDHVPRRVVPKRTVVVHDAPRPLSTTQPRIQPVRDHSAGAQPSSRAARTSASTNGKLKVFVDPPATDAETLPHLVKKQKARGALNSIKWALGDRTNAPKAKPSAKAELPKEPRSSIDSGNEKSDKEKWKWTIGRVRKDAKEKRAELSTAPGSQPSTVRLVEDLPSRTAARAESPISRSSTPALESGDELSRNGSIALRAMRSVRSMARIGGWARGDTSAATMSKRLARGSTKISDVPSPSGSGESWLVGPPPPTDTPTRDVSAAQTTMRPQAERRSSLEKQLPSILRFGSIVSGRRNRMSTSTASSDESVMPRESASTRAPSISSRPSVDSKESKRYSTSSRRSSGTASVISSAFWRSSSSIPKVDGSEQPTPTQRRDSKTSDGLRRSTLAAIFDLSKSSNSKETPRPVHATSSGSTGQHVMVPQRMDDHQPDPFAAGAVDSFLPSTIRALSVPPLSTTAPEHAPLPPEVRQRPASEQGLRSSVYAAFGDGLENIRGLTMVNAATDELSDLINRLDLIATPEASPATRRWLQATPSNTSGVVDSLNTVEKAIRLRYPEVSPSADSEAHVKAPNLANTSQSTPLAAPVLRGGTFRGLSRVPLSGSVTDLRGVGGSSNIFTNSPSTSSARPFNTGTVRKYPPIHLSPSPAPDRGPPVDESPIRRRTARRQRLSTAPFEPSTPESLRPARLQPFNPNARVSIAPVRQPFESDAISISSGRGEPISDSADDEGSDVHEEYDHRISRQSFATIASAASFAHNFSSDRPSSVASEQSFVPTSFTEPHHPFSITVTAPSLSSHDYELDDSPPSDEDSAGEDDTTRKTFDFTGEISKLNVAGSRKSFVRQLEAAFRVPDELRASAETRSPTDIDWNLLGAGSNTTLRKGSLTQPDSQQSDLEESGRFEQPGTIRGRRTTARHSRTNTVSSVLSAHELSLLKGLDASMYALATSSSMQPGSQSSLAQREPVFSASAPPSSTQITRDISLDGYIDSSPYKIAAIDLSLIHPMDAALSSGAEDVSTSQEAASSESAVEISRGRTLSVEFDNDFQQQAHSSHAEAGTGHYRESIQSISSFGSIVYGGVSDPFGYKCGEASELSAEQSAEDSLKPPTRHRHNDSVISIPSISSYGQIIKGGTRNPFGYASSFRTTYTHDASADFDESLSGYQNDLTEASGFSSGNRRRDSSHSTFYFRSRERPPSLPLPPLPEGLQANKRDDSMTSIAPPVSFYNMTHRDHQRNRLSNDSSSSAPHAYGNFGATNERASWARPQSGISIDSTNDFSPPPNRDRPGIGDKMFSSAAQFGGVSLPSIVASPSASEAGSSFQGHGAMSVMDSPDNQRSSGDSDTFSKTGQEVSDASIFDGPPSRSQASGGMLFGTHVGDQRRAMSVYSTMSSSTNDREDDTMISMLGGGHVARKIVTDAFTSSPCFKVKPRKKRPTFQARLDRHDESSISSSFNEVSSSDVNSSPLALKRTSATFGRKRMALATQGLLQRNSLENSALSGDGSDASAIATSSKPFAPRLTRNIFAESLTQKPEAEAKQPVVPVIPAPIAPDTPPASDVESMNSQRNIDAARISVAASDSPQPGSTLSGRIRARGSGHRRRPIELSVDVGSVSEEVPGLVDHSYSSGGSISSMASSVTSARFDFANNPDTAAPVDIVDAEDDIQHDEIMQRYMTLRKQALDIVNQSKMEWQDTDFSRFAMATFVPPTDKKALQAFYNHSVRTYTHLPTELCIRRQRTSSRVAPYGSPAPKKSPGRRAGRYQLPRHARTASEEQAIAAISPPSAFAHNSSLAMDQSFSSLNLQHPLQPKPIENGAHAPGRLRVTSKARRNAAEWSKRHSITEEGMPELSTHFTTAIATSRGKENAESFGLGNSTNTSLRISRPRPKNRPQSMLGASSVKAR